MAWEIPNRNCNIEDIKTRLKTGKEEQKLRVRLVCQQQMTTMPLVPAENLSRNKQNNHKAEANNDTCFKMSASMQNLKLLDIQLSDNTHHTITLAGGEVQGDTWHASQ